MLHTHNSTNKFKHLLALTLVTLTLALVGLTAWLTLPIDSARRSAPSHLTAKALPSNLAGQTLSLPRPTAPDQATQARVQEAYGKLPLSFEANHGQTDPRVKFLAGGSGYRLFLTPTEAVLALRKPTVDKTNEGSLGAHTAVKVKPTKPQQAVVRMKLVGANPGPQLAGQDELPGKSNYFIGNDPQQWRTNVSHYGKVKYEGVYPGVDLLYYGTGGQLEYDFVVAAGADPRVIKLSFAGADEMRIDACGDLVMDVGGGEIRQHKPVVYQEVEGVKQEVAGRYVMRGKRQVGIEVGGYDASRELVIDPVLVYSTYLGSGVGLGIAVDSANNAYVTGYTDSLNFPVTPGAFQTANAGGYDAFVTKLNGSGTALLYSTYLGGSSGEQSLGIAVDSAGNAYVTGGTG